MEKVKLEICCGTACYLLGAAKLMNIEEELPGNLKDKVDIQARTCLGLCDRDQLGGAPYVKFNDTEIMGKATVEKVLSRLNELVEGVQQS
jgi:NADH:ubiquinone oxidoreductase subunit E